jgi:hypothetical protein
MIITMRILFLNSLAFGSGETVKIGDAMNGRGAKDDLGHLELWSIGGVKRYYDSKRVDCPRLERRKWWHVLDRKIEA